MTNWMLEHNKKIILKYFVLPFVNCYVISNCYVGIEMLMIYRDRFGKSFGTVEFIGNIAVTVATPMFVVDILFNNNKIYLKKLRTF